MFERYSEHARSVIEHARWEAQKLRHDHLGTEHILLGLLEVKDGFAAEVLRHRNIDLAHAKEQVKNLAKHGNGPEDGDYETLPCTVHAQSVVDDAVKEARDLKHNKVGSEHLLLGLLYENEGTGAKVLRNLGLKLEDVRKDTLYFIDLAKSVEKAQD
jgi:ATP-dependent Clp protease ATP-binding subunit ClpC